jgi:crotonobetainyl-CoA:carnitine CoA-transferase CaiB-like acyl-CoA transferase
MMDDPRFATHAARASHIGEIYDLLADIMKTRSTADWIELLENADIPVAPMNRIDDLLTDPHLTSSQFFVEEQHPTEGAMVAMRTPTGWSDAVPDVPRPAPRHGEHTAEVLHELGYSETEIAEMERSGAVKRASAH